jgi:hypothetical protein
MNQFQVKPELLSKNKKIAVLPIFNAIVERADTTERLKSLAPAKNYFEFCELVVKALDDYQTRLNRTNKIRIVWDVPDLKEDTIVISISLVRREPGKFDQGAPFEGSVKNLRPVIREHKVDPNNPGYNKIILGKWYDNIIQFTIWSRTNKEAIEAAFWFEEFMEKYNWFFVASGVSRVIYWEQKPDEVINNDGKKLYGRPLCFYVKTEELTEYSEKEIEEIQINLLVTL